MSQLTIQQFRIPADDRDLFYSLPATEQARIKELLDVCFPAIRKARCLSVGYKQAARGSSFKPATLKRLYQTIKKSGDWTDLIRKYKTPDGLPEPFKQYWKALCERYQRSSKAAWRQLIRDWQDWSKGDLEAAMPGYATAPEADRKTGIPHGWTYENLINYQPSKYEQQSARTGTHKSFAETALVFTTRIGLEVGEVYQFDDVWHDHKVNTLGQRRAYRPLEFNSIDVASGFKNGWAIKAMRESIDGKTKTKQLNEREMLLLTVGILSTEGYRPQGTILVCEHGTAALTPEQEALLLELTDGAVTIHRSGISGGEAFTGQYAGQGKGNFRLKAALESLHNLMHNEFAALPGQMGKDRDHSPAELYGRDKLNNALLKAIASVAEKDSTLASKIILPFVEINQFRQFADLVYDRINNRTDHDLEGWVEAGYTTTEWRPHHELPWASQDRLLAMPPAARDATIALIESDDDLLRTRKMSPKEVYNQGRAKLVKLPRSSAAMLLKDAVGKPVKVSGVNIEFRDAEAGPGVFRFLARVKDAKGRETILAAGEQFTGIMNPYFPDTLDLIDAKGAWIGSCPTIHAPCKNDAEGLKKALGQASHINATLRAPLQYRGGQILKQRLEDTEHNNRMLNGGEDPTTLPFERKTKRTAKQRKATHREAEIARTARESQATEIDEDDY